MSVGIAYQLELDYLIMTWIAHKFVFCVIGPMKISCILFLNGPIAHGYGKQWGCSQVYCK